MPAATDKLDTLGTITRCEQRMGELLLMVRETELERGRERDGGKRKRAK